MKAVYAVAVSVFVVACGTAPAEDSDGTRAELRTVQTPGGPTCGGWGCAHAIQRTSDKEIFDVASRNGAAEATNPNVVKLAALECAEITDSCEPASCFLRTTCGGGGPVQGADGQAVEGWLHSRGAPVEVAAFARRYRAVDVVCVRSGTSGDVSCSFSGNSGSSSSGGTSSGGTSGSSGTTGSSGGTSGSGGPTGSSGSGGPTGSSGGTSGSGGPTGSSGGPTH